MKTKHLLILACIVIVLGIIYALQQGSRKNGSDFVERRELVPSNFSSDSVVAVKQEQNGKTVTLKQTDSGWTVAERFGYPADVSRLRDLFIKLCDARIAQVISLTPVQEKELSLTPEKSVTLTLTDKNGQTLQRFVFGSAHSGSPPRSRSRWAEVPAAICFLPTAAVSWYRKASMRSIPP